MAADKSIHELSSWDGAADTLFWVDPKNKITAVLFTHYKPFGKVPLHKRANAAERAACRFWLDAELARIKPERIVGLGATAAQAIFGRSFRLMKQRGQWVDLPNGVRGFATVHPSHLLRLRYHDERASAYEAFVRDLAMLDG